MIIDNPSHIMELQGNCGGDFMRRYFNRQVVPYVSLFLFVILFQVSRILQLKSPIDSIPSNHISYFFYGLLFLLVPMYLLFFLYLPSILIVRITYRLPSLQPYLIPLSQTLNRNGYNKQNVRHTHLQLLCVMRC